VWPHRCNTVPSVCILQSDCQTDLLFFTTALRFNIAVSVLSTFYFFKLVQDRRMATMGINDEWLFGQFQNCLIFN
jgi:hypothetical protein